MRKRRDWRQKSSMTKHDPVRFVNSLSSKLASRSRHVCIFLGAGASKACGLPDISELQERITEHLDPESKQQLLAQLQERNLEQALSRIRRFAALLEGDTQVEGLTRDTATILDRKICQAIVGELSLESADLGPMAQFASWAARADYHWPLEVFTVNYDLLVETSFEDRRLPYFDGFVGNIRGKFHTDLVEATPEEPDRWLLPSFVRLWKLHGSVNWAWDEATNTEIVRKGSPVSGSAAAIYPSDARYDESRRMPFLVLQDRFRRALAQTETLTLVAGYSFGDDHLNEMLFDAAERRPRSETIVFAYSEIPQTVLSQAATTPNLQAVTGDKAMLGGRLGTWEQPPESAPSADFWDDGRFTLGDFRCLGAHLALSVPSTQSATAGSEGTIVDG